MYERYAIYVAPDGPLGDFGAAWLGWDNQRGKEVPQPVVDGLDLKAITQTPRKYGFHGTIKPPFFLAPGCTEDMLRDAVAKLCAAQAPVSCDGLELSQLGRFLALTPLGDTTALARMAGNVVRELDLFRAPPSEAEVARRNPQALTPLQLENLNTWGYPYVMDAFRFHITLTGRMSKKERAVTMDILSQKLPGLLPAPFLVKNLTLFGQKPNGNFYKVQDFALGI